MLLGLGQSLDPLQDRVHQSVVIGGEGFGLTAALHHGVDVGVIIHVQHAVADIDDGAQGAVAHSGAATLDHGQVIGRGDDAHDLIFGHQEGLFGGFLLVLFGFLRQQGEGLADGQGVGGQLEILHDHALVGGGGPAALHQNRAVHDGVAAAFPGGDPVETAHHRVAGGQGDLPVQTAGRHDGPDALHSGDGIQVGLFQTQVARDPQVVEIGVVEQLADGVAHIGGGGQQPRQKAGAQGHDEEDRQKPAEAAPDGPEAFLEKRLFYHSISSTGMGSGLTWLLTILPLFT